MSFKSSSGRNVGKLLNVFQSRNTILGQGIGGGSAVSPVFSIQGGTIVQPGNGFVYHTFSSSGILTCSNIFGVQVLLVGGGGSGGVLAGGGGAGGVVNATSFALNSGTYTITIGAGGAAPTGFFSNSGSPGFASSISSPTYTLIARGGGGSQNQGIGLTGGSGGGAAGTGNAVGTGNQPSANPGISGITQYGNSGGTGAGTSPMDRGGGGGGAGQVGYPRDAATNPARGGDGVQFPTFAGPLIGIPGLAPAYFGGGGGGGSRSDSFALVSRPGGLGGGGTGETGVTAGTTNSGGGGGGGTYNDNPVGGAGGSGIFVLFYPTSYLQ